MCMIILKVNRRSSVKSSILPMYAQLSRAAATLEGQCLEAVDRGGGQPAQPLVVMVGDSDEGLPPHEFLGGGGPPWFE